MSKIRSINTKPELAVKEVLRDLKIKYKLHKDSLPGKPDIVLEDKTAIFVNGCFWHQHKGCKRQSVPKTNKSYWIPKLKKNIQRQKKNLRLIKQIGYKPIVIWECQTRDKNNIIKIIKQKIL